VSDEDAELVACCLRGDSRAVVALVERFQAPVYGVCVRLLQNWHDAEDVSQEVFLRVFRSLKRWDSTRPLKPWILGIAVNRCRTWLSQRQKQPELAPYLQDTAPSRPVNEAPELMGEIQTAVSALRPDYRAVFVLFHEQGHPYEEIAQAMNIPVGTVKTWLHRARLEVLDHLRRRGMISEVGHELP
jgi:RNA polymerase sigma factor (sigma-70 family)